MIEIIKRFQEWQANKAARKKYESWADKHPIEIQILAYLAEESSHKAAVDLPRRAMLYEAAKEGRRALGFSDDLVPYVGTHDFNLDATLTEDNVRLSEAEMRLLKEVNYGFWASAGVFTPGVRRIQNFREDE